MALKARNPEQVVAGKPKFMISGESGVGKSMFALSWPKPYLIDCEGGATREQYQQRLKEAGGAYFGKEEGSQDFKAVIQEVKELCTTKHEYKTLIIDSFTYLYMLEAAEAESKGGSDFGRDKKMANIPTRQLISTLEKCDLNVILICHTKTKWERRGKDIIDAGSTFDGYDKLEYILDLWCEIARGGKTFQVKKSRITGLTQGDSYPLSYDKFAEIYGKNVIEKDVVPIKLSTPEQVARISQLIEALKVPQETVDKWLTKCNAEEFTDMSESQAKSVIEFMEKQILQLGVKQ
jgi:AAA domain